MGWPRHLQIGNETTMDAKSPQTDSARIPVPTRANLVRPKKANRAALRLLTDCYGLPRAPRRPGPNGREQGPFGDEIGTPRRPPAASLGVALDIEEAAELIGCSPWTVRQTLIPRGLPHFRFRANGRLVFYRDQLIRWIENQQQGGNKTS